MGGITKNGGLQAGSRPRATASTAEALKPDRRDGRKKGRAGVGVGMGYKCWKPRDGAKSTENVKMYGQTDINMGQVKKGS